MNVTRIPGTKPNTPAYSYNTEEGYEPHLVMPDGTHIWTKIERVEWRSRDGKMHYKWNWGYATSGGGGNWWSEENHFVDSPTKDEDWDYIPDNEYMGRFRNR